MTSCGDEAAVLQIASTLWPPSLKRENSPSTCGLLQQDYFTGKKEPNNCEKSMPESIESGSHGSINESAAVFRQSLLLLQALQNQHQIAMASEASSVLNQPHQPAPSMAQMVSNQQEKVNDMRHALQRLVAEKVKAYGNPLSWENLIPSSTTNYHSGGAHGQSEPSHTGKQPKLSSARAGLGDLLPPPPRLPQVVDSERNVTVPCSNPPPYPYVSTSASVCMPPPLKNTENIYTSTSSVCVDKSQPLDLSTSNKRQHTTDCESVKENSNAALFSVAPGPKSTKQSSESLFLTNHNLPPVVRLPTYTQSNVPSSSPVLPNLTSQQLASLVPYLQSNPSLLEAIYQKNGYALSSTNEASNQEYLQKWLLSARQHQQVAALHQQQSSRKRSASWEIENQQREQPAANQYTRPSKSMLLSSGLRVSPHITPLSEHPKSSHSATKSTNGGKRYKRYAKPPYTYVSLITLSILSSPEKKLRLSQILKRIADMFPFFNGPYQGWRDSVRHNLSQNECFVKVLKNPYRPTAKGNYWTVNVSLIPHELLLRQNTLVSRYIQESGYTFRKDLTEVFDVLNGNIKVNIPQHLIKGERLIDEPATVMEKLLLEPKREDGSLSPDLKVKTRVYNLADLFAHEEQLDDDVMRQHNQSVINNKWFGKANKSRTAASTPKLIPSPQPTTLHSTYSQHISNGDLPSLAMHILQNSTATDSASSNAQVQAQRDLLAQALSGKISGLNCMPFLQNYFRVNPPPVLLSRQGTGSPDHSSIGSTGDVQSKNESDVIDIPDTSNSDLFEEKPITPKSLKYAEAIDSDPLESMSLPRSPERASIDLDGKSSPIEINQLSPNNSHSPVTVELSPPTISHISLSVPLAYRAPFTGFNILPVELAKSV